MKIFPVVLTAAIVASGCATSSSFKPSDLALVKNQHSDIAAFGSGVKPIYGGKSLESIFRYPGTDQIHNYLKSYQQACETGKAIKAGAAMIPAAAASAVVQFIYNSAIEKQSKQLKSLKESAVASYSSAIIFGDAKIAKYRCLVLSRHSEDGTVDAFTSFTIDQRNELLHLIPQAIFARNTIANTRALIAGEPEEITVVVGASVQGVGKQQNGLPVIASCGQDSKKLGKVKLNSNEPYAIDGQSIVGPIPILATSSPLILRISSTEAGDIGFDIDERIAANKALKEAIGPALAEGVSTFLSD